MKTEYWQLKSFQNKNSEDVLKILGYDKNKKNKYTISQFKIHIFICIHLIDFFKSLNKMSKGPISQFIEKHYLHFNSAALVDAAKAMKSLLMELK
jgi:hypothetical protein